MATPVPRVLNLSGQDITLWTESGERIVMIPSEGQLKLLACESMPYLHHHIHYYSAERNEEAALPVLSSKFLLELDERSLGYAKFKSLTPGDVIIATPGTARYLQSARGRRGLDVFTVGESPEHTVRDESGTIVGYLGLRWYP